MVTRSGHDCKGYDPVLTLVWGAQNSHMSASIGLSSFSPEKKLSFSCRRKGERVGMGCGEFLLFRMQIVTASFCVPCPPPTHPRSINPKSGMPWFRFSREQTLCVIWGYITPSVYRPFNSCPAAILEPHPHAQQVLRS